MANNDALLFDSMLEAIPYDRAKAFCEHIHKSWSSWCEKKELAVHEADEAAQAWFTNNWTKVIASFTWAECPLQVLCYPEELLSTEERFNATKILRRVKQQHVASIDSAVEVACSEATMFLPTYAREAFRNLGLKDFLREHYYSILDKVLREGGDATDFFFKPLVLPETIEDVDARSKANDLIAQVQGNMSPSSRSA